MVRVVEAVEKVELLPRYGGERSAREGRTAQVRVARCRPGKGVRRRHATIGVLTGGNEWEQTLVR